MGELLRRLLDRLDEIGAGHEELYDSDCRERMSNAIVEGFVRGKGTSDLPDHFGLHSTEGDQAVRAAIAKYITSANEKAAKEGLSSFHERLSAFQDSSVQSEQEGNFFDDFFGYSAPEQFDSEGRVVR